MPQKSLPLPLLSNTIKIKRNYQKQKDKKKRTQRDAGFFLKEKRQLNVQPIGKGEVFYTLCRWLYRLSFSPLLAADNLIGSLI